jgi:hypothetical protein
MLHTRVAGNYALGWGVVDTSPPLNAAGFNHNGSNLRWFAITWFWPDIDTGLLIVLNGGGDRGSAAMEALDVLLRQRIAASP